MFSSQSLTFGCYSRSLATVHVSATPEIFLDTHFEYYRPRISLLSAYTTDDESSHVKTNSA